MTIRRAISSILAGRGPGRWNTATVRRLTGSFSAFASGAVILLLGWAAPASAQSRFEREEFGPFTVETEIYENKGPPIMHVANSWTKVSLIWRSSDKGVELKLVDDGWQVIQEYSIRNPAGICIGSVGPVGAPSPPPSNDAYWRRVAADLEGMLKSCEAHGPRRSTAYRSEVTAANDHYPKAADHWKAASIKAFGNIDAPCVKTHQNVEGFPAPSEECVKWSGEQLDRAKLAAVRSRCGIKSDVLVYKSNLLLSWRLQKNDSMDEPLIACARRQLSPFKGVRIAPEFVDWDKG